jgi:exosome complex component CSL4
MKKIMFPGDRLATCEEYIPGEGTYEKDGSIFATVIGTKELDEEEKIANVRTPNPPVTLKDGDLVYCKTERVASSIATVRVTLAVGHSRGVTGNVDGAIHVSKVSDAYTDDVRREYRVGDIIRARVVQTAPSLQLSTNSPELGALKARCMGCRATLEKKDNTLYCERCDRTEHRKLADDYGEFTPEYESNKNQ